MKPISIVSAMLLFCAPLIAAQDCPTKMSGINSRNLVENCLKNREDLKQWENWLVDQKVSYGAPVFRVSRRSDKNVVIAVLPRALGISNQEFVVDAKALKSMGIVLPKEGLIKPPSKNIQNSDSSPLGKTLKDWQFIRLMAQAEQNRLSTTHSDENSEKGKLEFRRLVRVNRFLEAIDAVQKKLSANNTALTRSLQKRHIHSNIKSLSLSAAKKAWRSNLGDDSTEAPTSNPRGRLPRRNLPPQAENLQLQAIARKNSDIPSPEMARRRLKMQKAVRKAFFGTPHWDQAKTLLSQAVDANKEQLARIAQKLSSLWDRIWNGQGPNPFQNWAHCVSGSQDCR